MENKTFLMLKILVLLTIWSNVALACDTENDSDFKPFALEIKDDYFLNEGLITFQILSPIKKKDMYLRHVTAVVKGELSIDLDILETSEFVGDYYSSYLSVAEKHVDKIELYFDYNGTNKSRTSFALCANWKQLSLNELLFFPQAEKSPLPSEPPPIDSFDKS